MTFDIVFVLGLTLAALVLFALDRLRLDQIAMAVPVVLLLSGILTPAEAVSGLSSRATVTVGSMLVLGLGLRKTGLVAAIGAWARTAPLGGKYTRLFVLCLVCALLSPVSHDHRRRDGVHSRFHRARRPGRGAGLPGISCPSPSFRSSGAPSR